MSGRRPNTREPRDVRARPTGQRDGWAIVRQLITFVLLAILALTGLATFALQSSDPGPTIVGGALVLSAVLALAAGRVIRLRGR